MSAPDGVSAAAFLSSRVLFLPNESVERVELWEAYVRAVGEAASLREFSSAMRGYGARKVTRKGVDCWHNVAWRAEPIWMPRNEDAHAAIVAQIREAHDARAEAARIHAAKWL